MKPIYSMGAALVTVLAINSSSAFAVTTVCPSSSPNASKATVALNIPAMPGVSSSVWDDGTVSLAIPLENQGNTPALDVSIQSVQAGSGSYLGPASFPYPVGIITPGATQALSAQFAMTSQLSHSKYPLVVQGTYNYGTSVCSFQAKTFVTPASPGNGGAPKANTTVQNFTAETATYPAAPLSSSLFEANPEGAFLLPLGPPRNLFTTVPLATIFEESRAFNPGDLNPPSTDPNEIVFLRNVQAGTYALGVPPDPSTSGADPTGFVMTTANTALSAAVSYSTDYGKTFTTVKLTKVEGFNDPSNTGRVDFFPESDGGLCCDQVAIYVPSRNLMVWLLQYKSPDIIVGGVTRSGQNRLRIAWATPQAAAADFLHAWHWFDITPLTLGDATTTDWLDYPDLAVSNNFLWISVSHGFWDTTMDDGKTENGQKVYSANRYIVQASLNDMSNNGAVNLVYYEAIQSNLSKAHFAQSARDTMYYAAMGPDSSKLSVFSDPESSSSIPAPNVIDVSSYLANDSGSTLNYAVNAPDNLDWNQAPHAVLGATYVEQSGLCGGGCPRFVYFAFDAGRDATNGRPYPYVRIEKINIDSLTLADELDIWNDNFAYATPALVWRPGIGREEVAFSLARGGGGRFADNAVGLLQNFSVANSTVYVTTSSTITQAGSNGAVRYGDYFNVRNAAGPATNAGQGVGYATLGYAVTESVIGGTCAKYGCNVSLQYVLFGRNADLFPSPGEIIH
jgi:hypothetical protein